MKQNLFWAAAYNAIAIPLAIGGRVPPGVAAGAMMLSSLSVVLNALRLRRQG
jgi:Cu+-exporting ATPase